MLLCLVLFLHQNDLTIWNFEYLKHFSCSINNEVNFRNVPKPECMSSLNKQEDKARKMLEALNSTSVEWCFN